jgi:hypothetical protein
MDRGNALEIYRKVALKNARISIRCRQLAQHERTFARARLAAFRLSPDRTRIAHQYPARTSSAVASPVLDMTRRSFAFGLIGGR